MIRKVLILIRRLLSPFFKDREQVSLHFDKSGQEASDYIRELLQSDKPVMICRFGATELEAIEDYTYKISFSNALKFITKKIDRIGYSKSTIRYMNQYAGFFPSNKKNLNRFSQDMIDLMPSVDVLGSWRLGEITFSSELFSAIKVPLGDLEPYFHQNPWSDILEGKKVLIVHPFEESIREQYEKRDLIFKDNRVLPSFQLGILRSVYMSLASYNQDFETWFDALEYMKREIDKRDFDIAIIGCGAYGFPLAAYVKSIGKKAVHLGGATQMLFGIKSKSWEDDSRFHYLLNEHWVRPKETERPANYKQVEGGRYW